MIKLENVIVTGSDTVSNLIRKMDISGLGIAIVCNTDHMERIQNVSGRLSRIISEHCSRLR